MSSRHAADERAFVNERRAMELIARGEGVAIEFKAASNGVHDDVFETVCSFANGNGGDMFLGVNDHGQVVGLSREILDDIKREMLQVCSVTGLFTKPVPVSVQEMVLNRRHIVHVRIPCMRQDVAYKGCRYVRHGDADFRA